MEIAGQAALVTGGASGLGAATARRLAAEGAKVAILDRDIDRARTLATEIDGHAMAVDVTDPASAEDAVTQAEALHGTARILVCCAGVGTPAKAVGKDGPLPLQAFAQVVSVNLTGTFNLVRLMAAKAQAADPITADGERGAIVMTASVAAFDGQIGQVAYAASKGGVAAMTLPLAREFARSGLRVVTVAPGLFLTPMLEGLPPAAQDSLAQQVPFPARLGDPSEYADLVAAICRNPMLNGEVIRLDGAIRMAPK